MGEHPILTLKRAGSIIAAEAPIEGYPDYPGARAISGTACEDAEGFGGATCFTARLDFAPLRTEFGACDDLIAAAAAMALVEHGPYGGVEG
jgi:hypothetical protein